MGGPGSGRKKGGGPAKSGVPSELKSMLSKMKAAGRSSSERNRAVASFYASKKPNTVKTASKSKSSSKSKLNFGNPFGERGMTDSRGFLD